MRALAKQTDVSSEPPTLPGSFDTSSTIPRREAGPRGAARGVTNRRSFGTSLAKPLCAGAAEDLPWSFQGQTGSGHKQGGSALSPTTRTTYAMTAVEVGCHVMRGDLAIAIRDLQRCRRLSWISDEMRAQLGRCLHELTAARRMCP